MAKQRPKPITSIVREVLYKEIKWHRSHHTGIGCSVDYENGFIAGIKHARNLVCEVIKTVKKSD